MPRCSNCHTLNNANRTICIKCKAKLTYNEGFSCPNCKSDIGPFAKKCRKCGLMISRSFKANVHTLNIPKVSEVTKEKSSIPNIEYLGEVDPFTNETLIENYQIIANELKVYPRIVVHPRGTILGNYFAGFFHDDDWIEIVDDYLLISCLAHEMRHMYQKYYMPEMYYSTHITSVREYIDSAIERDARMYSMKYCESRGYLEELEYLEAHERKYNLFLKGIYSVNALNLNDEYFRENPIYPQTYNKPKLDKIKKEKQDLTSASKKYSQELNEDRKGTYLGVFILILVVIGMYDLYF